MPLDLNSYLYGNKESLKEYIPNFKYILHQVSENDFEKLAHCKKLLGMMKILHYNRQGNLLLHFDEIYPCYFNEDGSYDQKSLKVSMCYILHTNEGDQKEYLEKAEKKHPHLGEVMKTLADQLREEGQKEFIQAHEAMKNLLLKTQKEKEKMFREFIMEEIDSKFQENTEDIKYFIQNIHSPEHLRSIQKMVFKSQNLKEINFFILDILKKTIYT